MATIWITGGKGFIGRHLAKSFSEKGNIVFGIGHGSWLANDAKEWGFSGWFDGEIDASNLSKLMQISGAPRIVYHLAGGSSVGSSFQKPYEDFSRTVESSARLFEWLRLNAPEVRVVSVSSAAIYGAGHAGLITEDTVISPYSPYGIHKSMMESLCHSYASNFGLRVAVVRLFSVYGVGLEKQLIWDLCNKLAQTGTEPVMLGGSGNELRDWLHVYDAVALLWLAGTMCDESCVTINGGTGIATSIREIAETVSNAWGGTSNIEFSGVVRKGDPHSLVANCDLVSQLGFKPKVMLSEGIYETVLWFKSRK